MADSIKVDGVPAGGRKVADNVGRGAPPPPAGTDGVERPGGEPRAPEPARARRAAAWAPAAIPPAEVAVPAATASITIPLTITISLGQPGAAPAEGALAAARAPGEEALRVDPDWRSRAGYDPRFLGVDVPLPRLSDDLARDTVEVPEAYRRGGERFVLDYHHYSAAMSRSRGFAWYSAANVDGRRRARPALPKRRSDAWHIDPRIDDPESPTVQCGEELYSAAGTYRGHLTRYLDVAWGSSVEEALFAAADSFHFTNCCLQLSGFNQGKDRWQGLETFLLERFAREEERRMVVITGPVLRDTDPVYQNDRMGYSVGVPLQLWKVCALRRADGTLSATAFVMGQQDVAKLPGFEESFDVTATQRTIAEIEAMTGLDFGPLRGHDHLASGGAPGTLEVAGASGGPRKVRPLRSLWDVSF